MYEYIIKNSKFFLDGVFGAYMQVALQNDGPVTLELESPAQIEKVKKNKSPISKTVEMENNADR